MERFLVNIIRNNIVWCVWQSYWIHNASERYTWRNFFPQTLTFIVVTKEAADPKETRTVINQRQRMKLIRVNSITLSGKISWSKRVQIAPRTGFYAKVNVSTTVREISSLDLSQTKQTERGKTCNTINHRPTNVLGSFETPCQIAWI